ncbi:MAG: hypothetical protein QNJ47_08395 [Nostocaceae cyanobacterium]|nr:hypothetical protein [Nostocaceae cyanobacterium]
MTTTIKPPETQEKFSTLTERQTKRHEKLIETTYRNNIDSDYTEKIEELSKSFNYNNNRDHYWSESEQSLLYASPLYEVASPAQKLALNHLHWFTNYNYISNSETETVNFNQVTSSVFAAIGGYETLSRELSFETEQEYYHINAFRKIGLMAANALIGKKGLNTLLKWNSYKLTLGQDPLPTYKYYALRSLAKRMLSGRKQQYSPYLRELEQKNKFILKAPTAGMLGRSLEYSLPLQSFFTFNWGSGSPFMACQFYTIRMIANLYLKNMEHSIAKYCKKLENKGKFIPTPTAISRYHFLDESFHTTISQLLAKDMYKAFPKPTPYEKFVGNMAIYMMQRGTLGGLSGVLPHRYFADDYTIMELVYRLLQAPVFGMSSEDALDWMKRCFCQEHEGFYVASKNRQRLLGEMRRFFNDVDYLWTVNREMRVMAARGSIQTAIQSNTKTFEQFSRTVIAENS